MINSRLRFCMFLIVMVASFFLGIAAVIATPGPAKVYALAGQAALGIVAIAMFVMLNKACMEAAKSKGARHE